MNFDSSAMKLVGLSIFGALTLTVVGSAAITATSGGAAGSAPVDSRIATREPLAPDLEHALFIAEVLPVTVPVPYLHYGAAVDLNNKGQVLLHQTTGSTGDPSQLVFVDGAISASKAGYREEYADLGKQLNDSGAFVANIEDRTTSGSAAGLVGLSSKVFRFDGTQVSEVEAFSGVTLHSINNQGWLLGVRPVPGRFNRFGSYFGEHLIFKNGAQTALQLPVEMASGAELVSINDAGEVIGGGDTGELYNYWWRAVYFSPDQRFKYLPGNGFDDWAFGINQHGQIVGRTAVEISSSRRQNFASIWDNADADPLALEPSPWSNGLIYEWASDINRWGQIVGHAQIGGSGALDNIGVLWLNNKKINLTGKVINPNNLFLGSFNKINDAGVILGVEHNYDRNNLQPQRTFLLRPFWPSLAVDANRDGQIKLSSEDSSDVTNATSPYRFWLNDDIDGGDTGGTDIPGQSASGSATDAKADYWTTSSGPNDTGYGSVNGSRDLIDFFPVFLDLKQLLTVLPASASVKYKLKQADGALNFVYTNLTRDHAFDYQRQALATGFGPNNFDQTPNNATTQRVTISGVELAAPFLDLIRNGNGGVLLFEGSAPTTNPLVLSVEKSDGTVIAEVKLELSISGVEQMFRHLNLCYVAGEDNTVASRSTAPNLPESLTNGKNFVFLHGYNVNQEGARGWESDAFKKMWWSGNRAKFYGVTWRGADTKVGPLTPNLQINTVHAFQTAPVLANFLNQLNLTGEVTTCAHSLGNMLVLAALNPPLDAAGHPTFVAAQIARHFAFDAALPAEAVDGGLVPRQEMSNSLWEDYTGKIDESLWASEWFKLFPDDYRSKLTWRNRLSSSNGAAICNFYSDGRLRAGGSSLELGEEVLNYRDDYAAHRPTALNFPASQIVNLLSPTGENSWYYQETLKGLAGTIFENEWNGMLNGLLTTISGSDTVLSSNYGGWGFGPSYLSLQPGFPIDYHVPPSRAEIAAMTWATFNKREQPLFLLGSAIRISSLPGQTAEPVSDLYGPDGASFAERHLASLLAQMIPARTVAMGREAISTLGAAGSRNFDLSSDDFQSGWPAERDADADKKRRWLHSDAREIAYLYNHKLFEKWVELGNLSLP